MTYPFNFLLKKLSIQLSNVTATYIIVAPDGKKRIGLKTIFTDLDVGGKEVSIFIKSTLVFFAYTS